MDTTIKNKGLSRSIDDNLRTGLPKGLYIYSIRTKGASPFKSEKSIDGQGGAFSIVYNDIEAIVSEVDLGIFGSEEIQKKAEEDLFWIKEKCRVHEDVIEQSMKDVSGIIPVIPMKFGIIFKTKEQLEKNLAENYSNIKNRLAKIQGRQEYGIKIYLNESVFGKSIEERDESIKKEKKEIDKLPQGTAFFAQKKLNKKIDEICSKQTERLTHEIYEELFNAAEDGTREKTLGREITGEKEPMIFNAYFLIKEEKIGSFMGTMEKIKEKYGNIGYRIRCVGPLPNYHFVPFN